MLALQLTVLFTSVWVFLDSGKLGFKKDPSSKSFTNMGPIGWALGSLIFWIIVFPLYLIERRKRTSAPDSRKGMPLVSLGGVIAVAVIIGSFSSGRSVEEASEPVVTKISVPEADQELFKRIMRVAKDPDFKRFPGPPKEIVASVHRLDFRLIDESHWIIQRGEPLLSNGYKGIPTGTKIWPIKIAVSPAYFYKDEFGKWNFYEKQGRNPLMIGN